MKTYDTVIFDLDGTLLNTLEDLKLAVNHALANHQFPLRTTEEVRKALGNGVAKLMERCSPPGLDSIMQETLLEEFKSYYKEHLTDHTQPYEGIYDLLEALKKAEYKVAIVSNKLQAGVTPLANHYFNDYISVAIGETATIKKKPAPDMVLEALRVLKSSKEKAIYVGDSDTDIETAKNSDLYPISVLWGFRDKGFLLHKGAKTLVETPMDIFTFLKNS